MRTLPLTIALLVTTLPAVAAPRSAEAGTAICNKSLVTITGAGRIEGTPGNDVIQGSHGRDVIGGNGDSDQVYGGGDNDALAGGAANFDDWPW